MNWQIRFLTLRRCTFRRFGKVTKLDKWSSNFCKVSSSK